MRLLDDQLTLSPSDLHAYLECRHLTQLDLALLRGELEKPQGSRDATADLVARKGDEHERHFLQSLKEEGRQVVEIPDTLDANEAAAMTESAMREGSEVIYQGAFVEPAEGDRPAWSGFADFIFRVERPSPGLGGYSYEVADTKLARRTKPYFLLQLCFYSEQVARIQGVMPEYMHVVLGTNERHRYRLAEFDAYYRTIRDQYVAEIAASPIPTFPMPVQHCGLCAWSDRCDDQRIEEDHLSLVAGMRRDQLVRLSDAGIETLAELAEAELESPTPMIPQYTYEKIRHQARMQLGYRRTGEHAFELLEPFQGRGLALLPPADPGDLFFDMEGDPLYEDGLEYLFGSVTDAGGESFTPFWGHSRAEEKLAFENFIDFVVERRKQFPNMHVYHYAHYEVSALKKLMGLHGTREAEIDDLLRNGVFVDLYRVVLQSMRISQPSYSIKKVEAFYMEQRDTAVTDGENSIVEYERFLETREQSIIDAIADYNRDDCVSTLLLRDWLLERREEALEQFGPEAGWAEPDERPRDEETLLEEEDAERLARELKATESDGNELLAELLSYHWRENKPEWWAYFERSGMSSDELVEDTEAIGGLEVVPGTEPFVKDRSLVYELSFPPQEFGIKRGPVNQPFEQKGAGAVVEIDAGRGRLLLKRGAGRKEEPLPRALIPPKPRNPKEQRAALRRVATEVLSGGSGYAAARDVIGGVDPRVSEVESGESLQPGEFDLERAKQLVLGLQESYLFVQGPPGSGKTYNGSRMIVELMKEGKRVGVTANSHKAINNLLVAVEKAAQGAGFSFRGLKKTSGEGSEFEDGRFIDNSGDNDDFPGNYDLVAGTTWLFPRDHMNQSLDYLFIDEAGQIALADAAAAGTSARNLVLLGDPLQLPQVSQGRHPHGSDASVLEHLLGDDATVRPERGLFLDKTWRMHPDVTRFISDVVYEGRLEAVEGCSRRTFGASGELKGTGIRYLPVVHEGNSRSSVEEVEVIDQAVRAMLVDGRFTDEKGKDDELEPENILVVTPYNAQVQLLSDALPEGVRVGTVDKFQGQEAPVVFFSMATSSGAELPRNLEFLFSRNRLNVAISRAQCLAVLVASPELLRIRCHTVEQMQMVNALCRAVEAPS